MTKLYTKDEIVAKAKEVAHMIANTEEVEFFKKAEEQINENQNIREKIASLKTLQKQAVNFQHLGKEKALKMILEKRMEKRTMLSKIDFRENLGRRFLNVLDARKDEVRYVCLVLKSN